MNASPDLTMTALKMVSALGIVLGGMFIVFYFSKRFLNRDSGAHPRMIKIIASQYIGVKKQISLVEIPGAVLVLGITNDTIRLLTKIEDPEALAKLRQSEMGAPVSFSDHLNKITSRFRTTKSGD